jgi:undecaprenyl phosphate-alpha-L-ara4N flippase subunit ArnE
VNSFLLLAVAIAFNAAGQLLLKRATMGQAAGALVGAGAVFLSGWFLAGVAALGSSMLLWVQVLRKVPLTIAHPLSGAAFLIVPLASHLFWREPLSTMRLVGIFVIVLGIALVARGAS